MHSTNFGSHQTSVTKPFTTWAQAGFTSELLPIIPPGALLTPKSTLDPSDCGKTPGVVFAGGAWAGYPKWQELTADAQKVTFWDGVHAAHACGVGLQARHFPAVDIDVLDAAFARRVALLADAILGDAPERTGRPPKLLRPYRLEDGAEPITKHRVEFFLPGDETKHAVEVLGRGQQYVVEGVHPGTGNPYTWAGGSPVQRGPAGLTAINGQQVERFLDELVRQVEAAGGAMHARTQGGDDNRENVDQGALRGDADKLREALDAMGNRIESYDAWVTMCAAIKAAVGGDEAFYPTFEAWCLEYPGNTAEMARQKWDSLHPPYVVGADYVYRHAAAAGWTGYAEMVFTPLEPATDPAAGTPLDLTHDGVALRFANARTGQLRYDADAGAWYTWDGTRWRPDRTRLAFHYARELCREVARGGPKAKEVQVRSATFAGSVELFARADPRLAITADQWDADPWVLGHPAGYVDLKSGAHLPPDPAKCITKLAAAVPHDPTSYRCPRWEAFLVEATGGSLPMMRFLQQLAGYCLTGDTSAQKFFFILGSGGTGKSTFLHALRHALGDYAVTATMDTFTAQKHSSHSTDLAMLAGARLVTASETERDRKWADSRIKSITGGDPITARYMRQDNFTFVPQLKLVLVGNHAPSLDTVDEAMRRRLYIVPFTHKPARANPALPEQLAAEAGGILGWALRGLLDLQGNAYVFNVPPEVEAATAEYFDDQDAFGHWLEECTERGLGLWATSKELFGSWAAYAQQNRTAAGTAKSFKAMMEARGLTYKATAQARGFAGLRLRLDIGMPVGDVAGVFRQGLDLEADAA